MSQPRDQFRVRRAACNQLFGALDCNAPEKGVLRDRNRRNERGRTETEGSEAVLHVPALLIPLSVVVLKEALLWLCRDGCADRVGNGQKCLEDALSQVQ